MSSTPPLGAEGDSTILLAALDGLVQQAPVPTIDEIWIFPTRRSGATESTVIVASVFVEEDGERRRILTAHHTARHEQGKGRARKVVAQLSIIEHGVAPADRVGRLVDGVMRRLDEELAALPPRALRIEGEVERWEELIAELRQNSVEMTGTAER